MPANVKLSHEFVEFIPDELQDGILYVSVAYATAAHKCCCGCGHEVVTPLTPTDWKLIFDGQTVSLDPSIGNWSFPCQSHYWIRRNGVQWADRWSREQIQAGRAHDATRMGRQPQVDDRAASPPDVAPLPRTVASEPRLWRRILGWFRGK
jgi:hypothetical protein